METSKATDQKYMFCPITKLDPDYTKVIVCNENSMGPDVGSVYNTAITLLGDELASHAYWEELREVTFNLLGVTILDGHDDCDPNMMIYIVKTLNSARNYDLKLRVTHDEDGIHFEMYVEETDVFVMSAFCQALQMIGWQTGPIGDGSTSPFDNCSDGFYFVVPNTWEVPANG